MRRVYMSIGQKEGGRLAPFRHSQRVCNYIFFRLAFTVAKRFTSMLYFLTL